MASRRRLSFLTTTLERLKLAVMRFLVCLQAICDHCEVIMRHPELVMAILCQLICWMACLGGACLLLVATGLVRLPVELFWWPQSSLLGGAGFPPPADMHFALVEGRCPAKKVTSHQSSLGASASVRREPRWILDDLPCLNVSHLDAGVCVRTSRGASTMRCLPSFLIIGAQKAGSTDLRGLLSFHPYLDGPSSEVRFFTHIGGEAAAAAAGGGGGATGRLERRWREYLQWFPVWRVPTPAGRSASPGAGLGILGAQAARAAMTSTDTSS